VRLRPGVPRRPRPPGPRSGSETHLDLRPEAPERGPGGGNAPEGSETGFTRGPRRDRIPYA
jgi:hypothetical protein